MRNYWLIFLLFLLPFSAAAQKQDSSSLFFALNDRTLSKQTIHTIDNLIYNDIIRPSETITILGYADYLGSEGYNQTLSYARAKNVEQYLIASGIKKEHIIVCIGKGKIDRAPVNGKAGYADDRKVQIITGSITNVVKRNTLLQPSGYRDITTLKKNETLVLDNIYFLPGRHIVTEQSTPQLERLYKIVATHPTLRIQIEGHICCPGQPGTDEENDEPGMFEDGYDFDTQLYELSVNRAKAVYDYLIKNGIAERRLAYKGFGATRPLVKEERTEEDRNKNRRVEVRILDK